MNEPAKKKYRTTFLYSEDDMIGPAWACELMRQPEPRPYKKEHGKHAHTDVYTYMDRRDLLRRAVGVEVEEEE